MTENSLPLGDGLTSLEGDVLNLEESAWPRFESGDAPRQCDRAARAKVHKRLSVFDKTCTI